MVIRDYFNNDNQSHPETKRICREDPLKTADLRLAPPLDRLAAAMIDMLFILHPVILLGISPFKSQLMQAYLLNREADLFLSVAAMGLVVTFVVLIYQMSMHAFFGATLGKMFLGLRVVNIWSKGPVGFEASFLRSVFWFFDSVCLFVPHLSILSNVHRRPLHDRVADTVVLTVKDKHAASPNYWESSFAKGIYTSFAAMIVIAIMVNTYQVYSTLKNQDDVIALLEEEGQLCAAVGEAIENWQGSEYQPERLPVAMTLFGAGIVSKKCLTSEVDFLFQHSEPTPLAYLAQAFVYSDNAELSNQYLKKVCELDQTSKGCLMAQIVTSWSEEDWTRVNELFASMDREGEQPYLQVWAVRHYNKHGLYQIAVRHIEDVSPQYALAPFLSIQRAKAMWGMGEMEQARIVADVAFDNLEFVDRIDLATWMCHQEVSETCEGLTQKSCRLFEKFISESQSLVSDTQIALAEIERTECLLPADRNYAKLRSRGQVAEVHQLIDALELNAKGERAKAVDSMAQIIKTEGVDPQVQTKAYLKILELSESTGELERWWQTWVEEKTGPTWYAVGEQFVSRFFELRSYDKALETADRMAEFRPPETPLIKKLILAAYRKGDKKRAWNLVKKAGLGKQDRGLASISEVTAVLYELRRDFGADP